ncbi:hypothetical protein B0H66DRAFT_337560 [Apodospora peruviana]|uniref:Uncharacterized protein n=1 Tax=Apodospora peruviana TaxID=516989 RepID=A0AAE0HYY8_9PEZI|nr:hypothetical protein B0H66DRAFT_337560 [Apodospora peruviana]
MLTKKNQKNANSSQAFSVPHEGHPHPTSTPTTLMADSCTTRPTQTYYSTSGCAIDCPATINCTADEGLIIPCGCTSVAVRPVTTTICASRTPCLQCTTGWGLVVRSETDCPTASAPAATATSAS